MRHSVLFISEVKPLQNTLTTASSSDKFRENEKSVLWLLMFVFLNSWDRDEIVVAVTFNSHFCPECFSAESEARGDMSRFPVTFADPPSAASESVADDVLSRGEVARTLLAPLPGGCVLGFRDEPLRQILTEPLETRRRDEGRGMGE